MSTSVFPRSTEMQRTWDTVMEEMITVINDNNLDIDKAFFWVCETLDIPQFADNKTMWDSFYETWQSCPNRKH